MIIVGLGNPGEQYENTRHNVGFKVVDCIAEKLGIIVNKEKFNGLYGEGMYNGKKVMLLKPTTYMNASGDSVCTIVDFYKIPLSDLLVIYDDIDIEVGKIRIRPEGSSGTHNGMRSVIQLLGTEEFPRVRIGTGPVPEHWELVNYVLSEVPQDERPMINDAFVKACAAVEEIISNG